MSLLELALMALGYVVVGSFVGAIVLKTGGDDETSFGIGAFWPLSLPLIGTLLTVACVVEGVTWLVDKARLPSFLSRKSAEQKVLEYSEAPTKILAKIIASKILAAPERLNTGAEKWVSEDKSIDIWFSKYSSLISSIYQLRVGGKLIDLPDDCKKIVVEALDKALKIKVEREKADKEAKKQLAALEAVESLLLQPVKEEK